MKKIAIFTMFLLPALVFGANDAPKDFDIVPRTVNFLIFFGILFYLLKDFAKRAYANRINGIVARLEAIENKLKDSKAKKAQSVKDLELAKNRAVNLVETSKKEVEIQKKKLEEATELEIQTIQKSFEEQKAFEARKMTKNITKEVIDEVFSDGSIKLEQNELLDVIEQKVG
ncbi:MAG: F0F1 ATP synthase subunit B [Campylobacter sp.]|nr:F0F1 ATP synthase subunit B [Campylobacter sp.]